MSTPSKTVVIVDDDAAVLEATSGFLQAIGYGTRVFRSAEAFLASGCGLLAAYLLSDIGMPGLNGLDLLSIVRVRHPTMIVILMTALRDTNTRQRAIAGGARCLLTKPVLANDLIQCLNKP